MSDDWMRRARWRAAVIFSVLSWSSSSIVMKFDFLSQPTADVLLLMDNKHDSGGISLFIMSIHMQIMDAINSIRFMWARDSRPDGSIRRHAFLDAEYPPRPCSHASDL